MLTSSVRSLARGSLGSLAIRIATIGLAFLTQIVLARLLGSSELGLYVYTMTWLNLLAVVGKLGIDTILTRYVAAYTIQKQWSLLKGLVRFGHGATIVTSMVLALLTLPLAWFFKPELDHELNQLLLLGLALLPISALLGINQGVLLGLKRPWSAQISEPVTRTLILITVAILYVYAAQINAATVLMITLAASTIALTINGYWLHRSIPPPVSDTGFAYARREWTMTALPIMLMNLMRTLLSQSDLILIGWLLDAQSAGIYAIASRLADLASFGLQAVNNNLAPVISELHSTNQIPRLQKIVTQSARAVFGFTLLVCLGLGFTGPFVLQLFGPDFAPAFGPMLILLVGQSINAATGSVGYLMLMTGHQRPATWMLGAASILTITLNLLLIPRMGLNGAAISTAVGVSFLNLAMLTFVTRHLHIDPTLFGRNLHATA